MESNNNRRASVMALKPIAYRASQGISFSPEKRGEQWLNDCESSLQNYLAQIPAELHATFEQRYIELYSQWLAAMSRCISPMITGPAKFPTKRANKLNGYADNALQRMTQWAEKFIKRANRQQRLTGWAEIERLQDKVERLQSVQDMMKAANKICRSKKLAEVEKVDELVALGFSEKQANMLIAPVESWQVVGFAPYQLTNNLAKIKDAQARIARLTRIAESSDRELEVNGVTVQVCNSEERLRLCYDGKPSSDTIALLKRCGFKWSPSNTAWQRQLTDNAYYAASR
ncbi:MAG: hypothetical protein NC403_08465, partial [Muribaculaceae bacterium]|nr:hypothetical protein [Muribaculaceae bacterium]